MGVPDRTVTQNPQSKTKAPKGAAARTAAVLPLSDVVLFPPSGFPLSHKCPTQGNVRLAFWLVSYTIFCLPLCAEYAGNFVDFSFGLW